jgi:hypothetical protein
MTTPWSISPVCGSRFWWTIAISPEVLIFLFFMITDPKTVPANRLPRIAFGISVGLISTLLIAPQRTEFGAKVGLLGALTIACLARPLIAAVRLPRLAPDILGAAAGVAAVIGLACYGWALTDVGEHARNPRTTPVLAGDTLPDRTSVLPRTATALPRITFDPSMVTFGDEYATARTYDTVAKEVIYALEVEAEIVRRRDADLLRAVDHGARLDQMTRTIEEATGAPISTSAYTFSTLHFHPVLRGGQSGAVIGVDADGVERVVVYDAAGKILSEHEADVSVLIAVREAADHRWIIADLTKRD